MKRRHKKKEEIQVPVASMGDIAFLLIIFFMICSTFAKDTAKLKPPHAPDLAELQNRAVIVSIDSDQRLWLQGRMMPNAKAVGQGVAALIEGKQTQEDRTVLFSCDEGVPKRIFEPVLRALGEAGATIAAQGQPEKPK
ncbi:MAG: biopolymer transporter ExbD [Planctomycetes bacterium]|nr:biopolymer transporter ExbD [Planctomycetota bacterium]